MNKHLTAIVVIMTTLLSACATPTPPMPLPLPTPATAPQATTPTSAIEIGDNDKGKTFTAAVGARIRVVLHSTYWQFDAAPSQTIKQLGDPVVVPDMTIRIPGTGAGTVTVQFDAVAPGQATLQASRTTCGEALLCAEDQRTWQVTVVVK